MNRTDYLRFAAAIGNADMAPTHKIKTAQLAADVFEADNRSFRRAEFLLACGLVKTSLDERAKPKPLTKLPIEPISRHRPPNIKQGPTR